MRSKGGWIALGDLGSGRWTGVREDKMLPIASRSEVLQCVEERRGLGGGIRGAKGPGGAQSERPQPWGSCFTAHMAWNWAGSL